MALPASYEVLQFLADPNPQARQLAMSMVVSFSAKGHADRHLLTEKLLDSHGEPIKMWNGEPLDVIEQLKRLCHDQPLTVHDALSALINLCDSPSVAMRIGDTDFLAFLVAYIGDSVSLLADLACMLLSNLTKFDAISSRLLDLEVEDRPFYSFLSPLDLQVSLSGMEADPSQPDYEEKKAAAEAATKRIAESMHADQTGKVPALVKLIRAFEEGATVESSSASGANMRSRIESAKKEAESDKPVEMDSNGRPVLKRRSTCNFLASVFANVTVLPKGREFFVAPMAGANAKVADAYPIGRIMVYTEHADLIRRGGVISALKNVLFVKHAHKLLLAPAQAAMDEDRPSLDILPYILMPLIDGKELAKVDLEDQESLPEACQLVDENKPREKDSALRLMLVEALLLLCTSHYGRESLRSRGAYIVVREAHLAEPKEQITEAIVRLVNLLKRDESESSMKDAEIDMDVSSKDGGEHDEDLVIEEL
ncbi:Protein hgh1 [Malassezia caprae]|uniref:Protein HGH1 homolog n=1 Tax=Malassezia caprae TaxID=1381934 RepID=A0AAF0ECB8_9BASI|nr:Protein hgh1 [Malassezia caprae]